MTLDEVLASSRHIVSYGAGILTAFGLTKTVNPDVLITSFDHIFNGIKEISIGVGPLVAIGMGWWATHKANPAVLVATVSAMPEVKAMTVSNVELATAVKTGDPNTKVEVKP